MEEFDYVILGDEPAGLWLARRLTEHLADAAVPPRIAWVSFKAQHAPLPFPKKLADSFGLSSQDVWCAEIVTPDRAMPWEDGALKAAFPELTPVPHGMPATDSGHPTSAQLSSIRNALRHHPELLSFAAGIWKQLGRSHHLHAESLVFGALQCTELFYWDPVAELPAEITRSQLSLDDNPLEEVKSPREGGLSLKFRGRAPIVGRRWIVNMNFSRLFTLSTEKDNLLRILQHDPGMRAATSLYHLPVRVKARGVPVTVRPISVYFDTEEIPELHEEIWPFTLNRAGEEATLTLSVTAPREISLEALLDRFRQGVARLNRLFPFFAESLLHIGVPLSMETCHDEELRARVMRDLEREAVELYELSAFLTQTRAADVHALMPNLNCHLPYPIGPLLGADKLLKEAVRKKKKKPVEKASDTTASP